MAARIYCTFIVYKCRWWFLDGYFEQEILPTTTTLHPPLLFSFMSNQRLWISCYLFCVALLSCQWRSHMLWQWALIWFQFWFGPISLVMTEAELGRAAVWGRKHYQKAEIRWFDRQGKQSSYYLHPRRMENYNKGLTKSAVEDSFEYISTAFIFISESKSSICEVV